MKKLSFVHIVIIISSLLICNGVAAAEDPQEKVDPFRFGVGLGVQYGLVGLNLDYQFNNFLEADAGFGTFGNGFLGWVIGGRIYPFPNLKRFRPRFSMLYGVVGSVNNSFTFETVDVYEGPAFGVGFIWKFFRRHSIDIDIFYTTAEPPEMFNGFKIEGKDQDFISFGYGYHF